MPSGPKKRRAERKKNVLLTVNIEEGYDVKTEPVPVEVCEPVAVKIEPDVRVEVYEPVVHETRGVGSVEPAFVGLVEPVADSSVPAVGLVEYSLVGLVEPVADSSVPAVGLVEHSLVGLVEPVADCSVPVVGVVERVVESSMTAVGLVEPVVESCVLVVDPVEPVAESSMVMVDLVKPLAEACESVVGLTEPEPVVESSLTAAYSTDSCEGIVVVDNGDSPREESDQVKGKKVDQQPQPVVDVEENGLVQKSSTNGGVKLTSKVELEEVKRTIEEQIRIVEQVSVNLHQILANFD